MSSQQIPIDSITTSLNPKILRSSFLLDQEIVLHLNTLLLESSLKPPPNQVADYESNPASYIFNKNKDTGGIFDSILNLNYKPQEEDTLLNNESEVKIKDRNYRLSNLLETMKAERNVLINLLKQCDNERILFRKLNLELLKKVSEYKNEEICVSEGMKLFVDKFYALNYELLKKTCRRYEDK